MPVGAPPKNHKNRKVEFGELEEVVIQLPWRDFYHQAVCFCNDERVEVTVAGVDLIIKLEYCKRFNRIRIEVREKDPFHADAISYFGPIKDLRACVGDYSEDGVGSHFNSIEGYKIETNTVTLEEKMFKTYVMQDGTLPISLHVTLQPYCSLKHERLEAPAFLRDLYSKREDEVEHLCVIRSSNGLEGDQAKTKDYPIHFDILRNRSDYLSAASNFNQILKKDAEGPLIVNIGQASEATVEAIIKYAYFVEAPLYQKVKDAIDLLVTADFIGFNDLIFEVEAGMSDYVDAQIFGQKTIVRLLELAERIGVALLEEKCLLWVKKNYTLSALFDTKNISNEHKSLVLQSMDSDKFRMRKTLNADSVELMREELKEMNNRPFLGSIAVLKEAYDAAKASDQSKRV